MPEDSAITEPGPSPAARTEGIVPAPESAHAIAATVREAIRAREEGTPRAILFCLSGHGMVDMAAYDRYLTGDM